MKIFLVFSMMLMFIFSSVKEENTLIDAAAADNNALVVCSQTGMQIRLDNSDMKDYSRNLLKHSGKVLDTKMFAEIITNSVSVDTTGWKDGELKNLLVVQNREEQISKEYMIRKLNITGSKQLRFFLRIISNYNLSGSSERNIFYFSKPVYSNSGKYAVVQWENRHNGSGGGGISLYRLQENQWKEIGLVSSWK
jgi:hypothetical protein